MVSNGVPLDTCSGKKRKRKVDDNINGGVQEGARSIEAQGRKDLDQMDQSVESMDHISQLPDHVIHHILSLLRNVKDAIRTSVLSKRWRTSWYSFSILIFDERRFTSGIGNEDNSNKEMFRDYVSNSLHTHLEKKLYVQKLVVHMTSFVMEDTPRVDQWLSVAISRNIKELDLHVGIKNSRRYTLPKTVFSSKTLTGLRLSGCKLETCNNIMLPHLQKLYLRKIPLVEHVINNLISNCHSIEDLRFINCSGLRRLHVSNLIRLNRVEIHHCNQLKKVEIRAPILHTFWYCGKKTTPCKVNLEGCTSLKRLTLEHPQVTRDFCENQISNFPLLEKLDLSISDKMKHIMISNPHLQKFALKGCKKLLFALLYAPNLMSFECKGEAMPWIEIHPFHPLEAKLSFAHRSERKVAGYGDKIWIMMKEFIRKFDAKGFKLVLHSNKLVYEMIKSKDEDPICCNYNASNNKCWRHFLKDVKFEDLNDMKFEDIEAYEDKRTSIWYNWLKSSYMTLECQMTNLRLYWNTST